MSDSVGVVFITHHGKKHLPHCLPPFISSPLKPRILVVNSSSEDGTVELAAHMGVETLIIPRAQFNHGTTREMARKLIGTDVVVMMTPDAYAVDEHVLEKLVAPLLEKKASVSYARQIPHRGADFLESFSRAFNYPNHVEQRSLKDLPRLGLYTFFCSNACAAYLTKALDEIGGFEQVLFGEDTAAVAKLLRKGHCLYYAADAVVHHSHSYSLWQEFKRHFDIGLARKSYYHLFEGAGTDTKRGLEYARKLIAQSKSPYIYLHLFAKWCGYQIGQRSLNAPDWLKRQLSSQDFYWVSEEYLRTKC